MMNATLATQTPATDGSYRRRAYLIGAAATAVAVGGTLWAVLKGGSSDQSQLDSLAYVAGAALIVGIVLFSWLVPARIAARGTGLPFALVSIPLLYAFWSGIPILVGVAAILIGAAHRASGAPKRGRALAAMLVGAAVALLTLAAILFG
jgi:hypothetical protein